MNGTSTARSFWSLIRIREQDQYNYVSYAATEKSGAQHNLLTCQLILLNVQLLLRSLICTPPRG